MRKNLILILLLLCSTLLSARSVRIYGYVLDEDNVGIQMANVYIEGTTIGCNTNRNGYYNLQFDAVDTLTLVSSMIGYQTIRQQLHLSQDVMQINFMLLEDAEALSELEVRGIKQQTNMLDRVEVEDVRFMPDATGGSIESLLITFAGVSQNNELSNQYNVRGGNFDENSVYVNGIEIHRPLLLRQGQQEGLSFVNPDMVSNVNFSAGGFDASYGDKMSSVLDIEYKNSIPISKNSKVESRLSASLLGASGYVGVEGQNYFMMHGIRYKTSRYMLGALPTKGNYDPQFIDYQTYITWNLSRKQNNEQPRWTMSFLGNFSQNSYKFVPDSLSEGFGTFNTQRNLIVDFAGQEHDLFRTAFGALSLKGQLNKEVSIGFDLSGFYTDEREAYDITGSYILTDNPKGQGAGNTLPQTSETVSNDSAKTTILGEGIYHEHARNRLHAGVITFSHKGSWQRGGNNLSWGANLSAELISDHISEWEWRDSMGYSIPNTDERMDIYYSMRGDSKMQSLRTEAFVQDTYRWNTEKGAVLLNLGARFNYWSFNSEPLFSPRASVTYLPGWKHNFVFRLATGMYYQAPFYKELRDTLTTDGITRIHLNSDIRAQRSVHVVLGGDYYFRAWGRPFKLTAEAYYKYMDRVISYTVDNVRVRYSGQNDAVAYTTGLDLKLYGELVPGADSWISLSAMRSRENLLYDEKGWIPGPNEQRFAFTMFFQDYIPRLPQYRVHFKLIAADGLPFGSPRNLNTRAMARSKTYVRWDLGASRTFSAKTDKWMRKAEHVDSWSVVFEVFNIIDYKNVNSYFWVTDVSGQQWAFPNRLTGRMFNLRLTVDLK